MNFEKLRRMSWKQLAIIAVVGFCGITSCIDGVTGKQRTKTAVTDATVTVVATSVPTLTATNIPPTDVPATQAPATATMEPTIEPTAVIVSDAQQPTKIAEPKAAVAGSDSFPCADGQIKGNINSNKYHVPGGQSYAKTVDNVICFNTAQEAEAAKFVRAKR